MIIANEKNSYDECFIPSYRLSINSTSLHYKLTTQQINSYHNNKLIIQWSYFINNNNPILYNILYNIVDIIHHEYLLKSIIIIDKQNIKSSMIMCCVGPSLFTVTIRNYLIEQSLFLKANSNTNINLNSNLNTNFNGNLHSNIPINVRFAGIDFKMYHGQYSVGGKLNWTTGLIYPHFVWGSKQNVPLLSSYFNSNSQTKN